MNKYLGWLFNLDSQLIAAWAAAASAVSGFVLAAFTFQLNRITRILAEEAKRARQANEQADVQCAVEPHEEYPTIIEFVIANTGRAAARQVTISIEPGAFSREEPVSLVLSALLPEARFRIYVNSFPAMKDKVIRARITYEDAVGAHERYFEQDVRGWLGFARISSNPSYKIARAVEHLERAVSSWAGQHGLKVETFDRHDRARKDQDDQAWLTKAEQEMQEWEQTATTGSRPPEASP